ncbi:mitochondrial carrier [Trichodelitschia bisporula]|uniref:Mitochondrial carrier n=1 Tax=Trichodelitschia bisporula TaxID=703511 RepID=A0A6G1I8T3_9PEZI|nr:mitochondrial carrier [Trichodelitschia bisporula]
MSRIVPPVDGKAPNPVLSKAVIEGVSGFTAGAITTLTMHPLDVLKTRLQLNTQKPQLGTSFRILRQIVHTEGNFRALYRGLMPNFAGNSISWSLYFLWYDKIKTRVQTFRGDEKLSMSDYLLSSASAGTLTAIFTNPIWVVKTRMLSSGRNAPGAYRSMSHGLREIVRTEGVRGFWRGLIPSLFGISHGAVQFAAYEMFKNKRAADLGSPKLNNWDILISSGASKIVAGSVTYPYQVVKVRLQSYEAKTNYLGVIDVLGKIWKHEGVMGFYKGLGPNLVRVLPSTCVTFLVYENMKTSLPMAYDHLIGTSLDT